MKEHPGYFALICIVAGILVADLTHLPAWAILVLVGAAAAGGWISLAGKRTVAAAAFFGFVLLGLSSLGYALRVYDFGPDHLNRVVAFGERYRVAGKVDDWPHLKTDRTDLIIAVDTVAGERALPAAGRLLVRLDDTTTAIARGDRIDFYGTIFPVPEFRPSGGFDYGRYLRLRSIGGIVYLRSVRDVRVAAGSQYRLTRLVDRLRSGIIAALHTNLDRTSAALAAGFLIGETRDIPPDIYRQFRDSGTLHLLAVSGSNVALVLLFALVLLRPFRIGRRPRAIILLLVVALFTMLSYEQPSVVRAAVMAALVIIAGLVERRIDLNHIVAVAAVIILLAAPTQLFDIGFQLSFVTAWGLIFATPRVYALFPDYQNRRWFRWLALPLTVAVIAQLFSTPLVVLYFQRIPLISPLANLVIVPMVSLAVVGVMVVLVAALLLPPLAGLAGLLLDRLMHAVEYCLGLFTHASVPLLETGTVPVVAALVAYCLLVLLFFSLQSRPARRILSFAAAATVLLVLGRFAWPTVDSTSDVEMRIATVPGGVAAVVRPANSRDADLILTGLAAKDYPVDQRVVRPLLSRSNIRHVRSITLLSADFDALQYVARLADSLLVARLYLHQRLEASWSDYVRFSGHSPLSPVTTFGGVAPTRVESGLTLDAAGVRLTLRGGEVVIADPRAGSPPSASVSPALLLLPRRNRSIGRCLAQIGPDRFDWVVCAEIAQGEIPSGAAFPRRLVDLSRFGDICVRIDREDQNSLQVIGLE